MRETFSLQKVQKMGAEIRRTFRNERLRMVFLDCPKEVISDDASRDVFSKIMRLRILGYGAEYPKFVVPCDTTDFFGTHLAVCKEEGNGRLEPLMAYKMLSVERSKEFRQPFFAMQLARDSSDGSHVTAVEEILASADARGVNVGYSCSWTISPEVRKNRPLAQAVRNSIYLSHSGWQTEYGVPEMLIAGVLRFKTPEFQQSVGYEPISYNGKQLGSIKQKSLGGEEVILLHMKQLSELSKALQSELADLWSQRIVFSARTKATADSMAA